MCCVNKISICKICKLFDLPFPDEYDQDWEYTVGEVDQLSKYIEFYNTKVLTKSDKFTLMIIIISTFDDLLSIQDNKLESNTIWLDLKQILISDYNIHHETILYWAMPEYNIEDAFAVSKYMGQLMQEFQGE